jgi:hypothetical protein
MSKNTISVQGGEKHCCGSGTIYSGADLGEKFWGQTIFLAKFFIYSKK